MCYTGKGSSGFVIHPRTIGYILLILINHILAGQSYNLMECEHQNTTLKNRNKTVYWDSKHFSDDDEIIVLDEIVVSRPPCSDDGGHLGIRLCKNSNWEPEDFKGCTRISQYRRCPLSFEETKESCRFISEPKPWGIGCSEEAFAQYTHNVSVKNEFFWLPYRRYTKFGPYESVTRGDKLGHPFEKPLHANLTDTDFFEKDCLIANPTTHEVLPEFCSQVHKHVCEFNKKEANSKCPKGCISADIVLQQCHCKKFEVCPVLSKIDTIFDLTILQDLVDDDTCYIDSNIPPQTGSKQALTKSAWFYTNSSLDCSLCSINTLKSSVDQNVEMVLNFEENNVSLILTIYSPDALIDKADENTIYCFTTAAQYDLKRRVLVKKIAKYGKEPRSYNVYNVELEKYIGEYWCEAYKDFDDNIEVLSNRVLAYKEKPGNEYALRVVINLNFCIDFPCYQQFSLRVDKILDNTLSNIEQEIRVMEIIHFDFKSIDVLLHITTRNKTEVVKEYFELLEDLSNINGSIVFLRSSEFCLPEFDSDNNLSWPLTLIGQSAVPEEMCLQSNGLPVVRVCSGSFAKGTEWRGVIGKCEKNKEIPDSSKYIQSILNQNVNTEMIANITTIIKNNYDFPVLSVYMVSKFLNTMYYQVNGNQFDVIRSTVDIADNLLNVNKESLVNAQELLNVTDLLVDLIDNLLISTNTESSDVLLVKRSNVILQVTNPLLSGVSGFVVFQEDGQPVTVENLWRNSSFMDLNVNALLAVIIPEDIIIARNTTNFTIITTVYLKDYFFESDSLKKPSGTVVSVTIPQLDYLPSTIPILFRASNYLDVPECGFWEYGKKSIRHKGTWSKVGANYIGKFNNNSNFHVCEYSHLTHFSLLRMTLDLDFSQTEDTIVDVIFFIGDGLTIFGITGIFLTALIFKRWRKKQGTIILLNLSIAILLEVFLMQATGTKISFAPQGCGIIGIFLHYIIISKFAWMLVYSFLQYMRFVKVLRVLPENIVIKSVLFGWGFALVPVCIVNIISRAAYAKTHYHFCYPTGLYLYLGCLLPIVIIVLINTYVFIIVMREVTSKTVESHGTKENIHKLQTQLAILLFFVLGVPWLFWIFATLIPVAEIQITLAYLFCITSNLQGFILFLFYVIFNNETRIAWLTYFNKKRPKSFSISTKISSRS